MAQAAVPPKSFPGVTVTSSMDRDHAPRASIVGNRGRVLVVASALVVAIACGDPYLHTNPYDSAYPVEIAVTGPDSLFSLDEQGAFAAQEVPPFPDSAIGWIVDSVTWHRGGSPDTIIGGQTVPNPGHGDTVVGGELFFKLAGSGTFVSIAPPLDPLNVSVTVEAVIGSIDTVVDRYPLGLVKTNVYRHVGYKSVVLTQRVTSIQLRCPDSHACAPVAAGGTWSVWVDGRDALGHLIAALTGANTNPASGTKVATFAVRDSTIAAVSPVGIRAATVRALRSGSTWVVATRGVLLDSLQLVVP